MIYSHEVENMCTVKCGASHGCAPIPEEGNGLGLAIVKSYVEATGGNFDIEIDGDLFKAIIKYSRIIA